ncbi:MAG: LysM peptidoglycan-binding domain-containing protein [Candidatus Caenarcaniphilales bacterium]|nr:LysM peptidoglycan-binding domain-containing protein [Candidatus Caenarcaniphilales bacterium]
MNTENIFSNLKRKMLTQADQMLSEEVKEELGIKKYNHQQNSDLNADAQIGFFQPVDSQLINNREAKSLRSLVILVLILLVGFLGFLFFKLIAPSDQYINDREGITIVDGTTVHKDIPKEEEPELTKVTELEEVEINETNLTIEDIKVAKEDEKKDPAKKLAKSPLLKTESAIQLVEYRVQSGDTLDRIAKRFYGSASLENINKIKTANKIRNARYLQIGQKLIIPY